MAHPGGRPTKLTEEVIQMVDDYYLECLEANAVPTTAALAVKLDISKKTLYNWGDQDPEFLHTLDKIQTLQEANLIKGSLENKLNPTISKLMLANHGYREKTESDITSGGEPFSFVINRAEPS